jgi:hypothetical protein
MTQVYSDPDREDDPYALPNVEVFYVSQLDVNYNLENLDHADEYTITVAGWYWWPCFPGCYPDGDALGPFDTEAEATADARKVD